MVETPDTTGPIPVRDGLLDAAEQVIVRSGISNLTLEGVAREAGVSKGGLLYHFPSKSALITGIVERLVVRCEGEQQVAVESDPQTSGAFTRAYLAARTAKHDPQRQPLETALLAAAGADPQYLEPLRARYVTWQARFEGDGIDPVRASIVRLAVDGLALAELLGLAVPAGELRNKVIAALLAMTVAPQRGEVQLAPAGGRCSPS